MNKCNKQASTPNTFNTGYIVFNTEANVKDIAKIIGHKRFRAAYDFLLLRCESGELDMEIGEWWERFQHANEDERRSMLLPGTGGRRRRRRRKKPKSQTRDDVTPDQA